MFVHLPAACVAVQKVSNLLPPRMPGTNIPQTYELQRSMGKCTLEELFIETVMHQESTFLRQQCLFCENAAFPKVCMTCIRCKSCGVTPGKTWDMAWNHEQDLCPDCTVLHSKGRKL